MCQRPPDWRFAQRSGYNAPRYKIRPHCSQLTISFPALTRAAVAVVTFMWQPVQTPCSTATIAASPLLLKRRSNWSSTSGSILDASASRSFASSACCVSSAFDFVSRSANCRETLSFVARALFIRRFDFAFELVGLDHQFEFLILEFADFISWYRSISWLIA